MQMELAIQRDKQLKDPVKISIVNSMASMHLNLRLCILLIYFYESHDVMHLSTIGSFLWGS